MPEHRPHLSDLRQQMHELADPRVARSAARFFKTGPGQYGEGDEFLGLRAAVLHALSREYRDLPLDAVEQLLQSALHEERLVGLLILVRAFEKAGPAVRKQLFHFYLAHTHHINNWDLVDCSAPYVVGGYLSNRSRKPLYRLARSKHLWERRMAIVATLLWIRNRDYAEALAIIKVLLQDEHDLIHKACGWMLREVGKTDGAALERFLEQHHRSMPRTMLRYAIERFSPQKRKRYLLKSKATGAG
jgi:3-methyladenine DNA glycosylase AlkD